MHFQNKYLHLLHTKRNDMKTFNSFKPTENSNRIVSELNASVLTATFKSTNGSQLADLYKSKNSSSKIVAHNTCEPFGCEYVETIKITFN